MKEILREAFSTRTYGEQWMYVIKLVGLCFIRIVIDVAIDRGTLDAMIHCSLRDPARGVRDNIGNYVNGAYSILTKQCVNAECR
jgi:hypothetical protein